MQTNKLQHVIRAVSLVFVGMVISLSSQAQALNQEFITMLNGDLWKFDVVNNTSTQLTTWGYNMGPILSPNGLKIAFNSIPPESIARQAAGEYVFDAVTNINIMDIATEQIIVVAEQVGARPEGLLRSTPVWSPDSTKLLWAQFDGNSQVFQIYDLNTNSISVLADNLSVMVGDADMVGFSQVEWSLGGIATMILDYTDVGAIRTLQIYNADTGAMTAYEFPIEVYGFVWVNYQGRNLIALESENAWELFDQTTGSRTPLDSSPRLKNKFFTSNTELLQVQDINNPYAKAWQVDDGQSTYATGYTGWNTPAISPDGTIIAWHDDDGVNTWQIGVGQTRLADNAPPNNTDYLKPTFGSSVAWVASEWYINDVVTLTQPTTTTTTIADCKNSPPTRLTAQMNPSMNAIVLPGEANNIRDVVGGKVIGKIPGGSTMEITGESKCDSNGLRYYPITFNGIVGWTAEGQGAEYWIEPVK